MYVVWMHFSLHCFFSGMTIWLLWYKIINDWFVHKWGSTPFIIAQTIFPKNFPNVPTYIRNNISKWKVCRLCKHTNFNVQHHCRVKLLVLNYYTRGEQPIGGNKITMTYIHFEHERSTDWNLISKEFPYTFNHKWMIAMLIQTKKMPPSTTLLKNELFEGSMKGPILTLVRTTKAYLIPSGIC